MSKKLKSLIASGLAVLNMGAVFSPVVGAGDVPLVSAIDAEERLLVNDFKIFKNRVDLLLNRTISQLYGNLNACVEFAGPYGFVARIVPMLEHCESWRDFGAIFRYMNLGYKITTGENYDNSLPRSVKGLNCVIGEDERDTVLATWYCVSTAKRLVALNAVLCLKNLVKKLISGYRGYNSYADLILKLSRTWTFNMVYPTMEQLINDDDSWMDERKDYFEEIKKYCVETLNYFRPGFAFHHMLTNKNRIRIYVLKLLEMCREVPQLIDEAELYSD